MPWRPMSCVPGPTDTLAREERANQGTQAQVFAKTTETGLSPNVAQQMVSHTERQQRLMEALGTQCGAAQTSQTQANQRSTEQVLTAIGAQAQAHQGHLNTMSQVSQSLLGSVSNLEQAAAAMAGQTGNIGPQITTAMGQMSGQIGQAVSSAMASQLPLPPPASIATTATPTVVATAAPVTPPAEQLTTLARVFGGAMDQGARELSQLMRGALRDFFVQATQPV